MSKPKNHVLLIQASASFRPNVMHAMPEDGQIASIRFLIRNVTQRVAINAARAYNRRHLHGGPEFDGTWAMVTLSLRQRRPYGSGSSDASREGGAA